MCVHHTHAWSLQRPEEGIGLPGTGVPGGYELPCGAGNGTLVLWKSSKFSSLLKPPLQPLRWMSWNFGKDWIVIFFWKCFTLACLNGSPLQKPAALQGPVSPALFSRSCQQPQGSPRWSTPHMYHSKYPCNFPSAWKVCGVTSLSIIHSRTICFPAELLTSCRMFRLRMYAIIIVRSHNPRKKEKKKKHYMSLSYAESSQWYMYMQTHVHLGTL